MFKKIGIVSFMIYYVVFMILPNLPLIQYYYGQFKYDKNTQIILNNDSKVLIGDICFLKALMDRTSDSEDKKDEAPPEPNTNNANLIYIISELTNLNTLSNCKDIKFQYTNELLTYRYLQIPSPPPKYSS